MCEASELSNIKCLPVCLSVCLQNQVSSTGPAEYQDSEPLRNVRLSVCLSVCLQGAVWRVQSIRILNSAC